MDIGGGTGNFSQALGQAAQVAQRVLCVDPFPEMLAQVGGERGQVAHLNVCTWTDPGRAVLAGVGAMGAE